MNNLADDIELYILAKLASSPDKVVVLQRKDIAQTHDCAPSQISYVLSTRFNLQRGYLVESRRGSGGYIRIMRVTRQPISYQEDDDEGIEADDAWRILRKLRERNLVTSREERLVGCFLEMAFDYLPERQRNYFLHTLILRLSQDE